MTCWSQDTNVAKDYPYSYSPVCSGDAFKCAVFQ